MKKFLVSMLFLSFAIMQSTVFAVEEIKEAVPPKWEDWVPEKYQNPRTDFSKGSSIAELSVGIFLTDLLITAPIGIPMICHGTTKIKNVSYSEKKEKFEKGLAFAKTIESLEERQQYYDKLPLKSGLKPSMHNKILKKQNKERAKEQAKTQKKAQKANQK